MKIPMKNNKQTDAHNTFSNNELLLELAAETNTGKLVERILEESQRFSNADGGSIYLLHQTSNETKKTELKFAVMANKTLNTYYSIFKDKIASSNKFESIPLYDEDGHKNLHNVVTYAALNKKVISIDDAYDSKEFDFSGTRKFDKKANYHSQSFLTAPLLNHEHDVIGVLQLINAKDNTGKVIPFSQQAIDLVTGLAGYAAIALNNKLLVEDLKNLLDAFIQCIAQAIDAKSSHTSAHCQRIPILMELIAQAACDDKDKFKDFNLNDDDWYELKVASWLHDCGKLATPDSVLDKSTKLHLMQDGIETIKARFQAAILANDKQALEQKSLEYSKQGGEIIDSQITTLTQYERRRQELHNDLEFIILSNKGGEYLTDESKNRLHRIASQTWIDSDGLSQKLLTPEELDYLLIERGTLSAKEREQINNHMTVTIDMLESLPFPKKQQRVSEYAGGHHEKMDGSGFPKGLTREEMSIPARMLAIADIFEALTSKERPYKQPMKISQSLEIMNRMKDNNHIDADLFELFVNARVWEKYAKLELLPEQLDIETTNTNLL